jgi:mannose-6-phosphate isomerase-like protein (cupin superfamily)
MRRMRHFAAAPVRSFFKVLHSTRDAQAAMMTLRPGQSSSEQVENEHPRCEQWCYVVRGSGRASVGKRRVALRAGSLLLIEKNEPHQVTNTGRKPLVTLNFYCPPAYDDQGDVKLLARVPTLASALKLK